MNWLITGGCGFIGRALISKIIESPDNRVVVIDNFINGGLVDLKEFIADVHFELVSRPIWKTGKVNIIKADVRDYEDVNVCMLEADVVVHLAANTGVEPAVKDPFMDCDVNVRGTLNVLEAARRNEVSRVILASSGAPLGEQTPPLHEEMVAKPVSPYGASKLAAEAYCGVYDKCFSLHTNCLRFGNVYGPGSGAKNSVVAKFIRKAFAGEQWEIYGDGAQTRDFIYVFDLVDAIVKCATTQGIAGETFQIATSRETSVTELAEALRVVLRERVGLEVEWCSSEPRQGDVSRNYSDTTKALDLLGWKATVGLDAGLTKTVEYFLSLKR
mgnify:CR=1 FL=1